ncbi:MAG: flagellar motor protein [Janthinobacterium lividum]
MSKPSLDRSTLIGTGVALFGIIAGLWLDGGSIRQVVQPTAALIVGGGTLGAVMLQFPLHTLEQALKQLKEAIIEPDMNGQQITDQLVRYCSRARRQGMVGLDGELPEMEDDFLRKALTLGVDGFAVPDLRRVMERDLLCREEQEENIARVFEAAGGFSPTLGIMGAVLGLIQVMQRMDNIGEIGKGIAVAFVSTLYGIGLANLLFLPLAGKLRIRFRARQMVRGMALEAVVSIVEGISPVALRHELEFAIATSPRKMQPLSSQELLVR